MKARYLILTILLVLALMMAGCTDDSDDDNGDVIEDDDDDGDDDDTTSGNYARHTIKELLENPYTYSQEDNNLVEVKNAKVISVKSGGYSGTISDDSTTETLTLYGFDENMGLKSGDIIDVQGIFEQYQNQYWEIKIRSNTDDEVKVTGSETITYEEKTVKELLENPESFNGLLVRVENAVVTDKESFYKFHISDSTTSDSLFVYNDGLFLKSFKEGDTIDIQGEFIKYNNDWELKLRNNTDDGITYVVEGNGSDDDKYDSHTVSELLGDAEGFNGDLVEVKGAKVSWTDSNNDAERTLFGIVDSTRGVSLEVVAFNKVSAADVAKILPGAIVDVKGKFSYYDQDKDNVKDDDEDWQIVVSQYSDTDSVVIVDEAPDISYEKKTVKELLDNPETYNETDVKIDGATIVTLEVRSSGLKINISDSSGIDTLVLFIPEDAEYTSGIAVNDTINIWGQFKWWAPSEYWEMVLRENGQDKVEKV